MRSGDDIFFCIELQKLGFKKAKIGFICKNSKNGWAISGDLSIRNDDFVKAIIIDGYLVEQFANEIVQTVNNFKATADGINHLKRQKII